MRLNSPKSPGFWSLGETFEKPPPIRLAQRALTVAVSFCLCPTSSSGRLPKFSSSTTSANHAFKAFSRRPLPRTEMLAERCLSLPLLELETVAPLASTMAKIQAHHRELKS